MNAEVNCRDKRPVLSAQVVPLLALAHEWVGFGKDAFLQTDLILLLLRCVSAAAARAGEGPSVNDIQAELNRIGGQSSVDGFLKCLEKASSSLLFFTTLFDRLAESLEPPLEDSAPPQLLDADVQSSVLGLFMRSCLLEFHSLTFPQLTRFHDRFGEFIRDKSNWDAPLAGKQDSDKLKSYIRRRDFLSAVNSLTLSDCREVGGVSACGHNLEAEALQLASLHGQLGHSEEGLLALQEAIQLAQDSGNKTLLEHALAWLHKLKPYGGGDATAILTRFTKNAEDLKLPLLGMWGRLQLARTQLSDAAEPKCVLETLLSSSSDFATVYEEEEGRDACRASLLALQAAAWEHFEHRPMSLHYAQLLCHMTSCDPLPGAVEHQEAVAVCVGLLAKHAADMGSLDLARSFLSAAKRLLSNSGLPYKLTCRYYEEVEFDSALLTNDFNKARQHLRNIETLDKWSSRHRLAQLLRVEGNLRKALASTHSLIHDLKSQDRLAPQLVRLLSQALLLLAELWVDLGSPSVALAHALEAQSLCHRWHLSTLQPSLTLARLQLCLGCPAHTLALLRAAMLHCQTSGSATDRGRALLLHAQASLSSRRSEHDGKVTKEDILATIPVVTQAAAEFRKCSARQQLREVLIFQAHMYNAVGYTGERDKIAALLFP